jgi:hypothetical protein
MAMDPTGQIMDEFVTVMSLFAVVNVIRNAGSDYGPKRSVRFTMMLWLMRTGNVLICLLTSKFPITLHQMKIKSLTVDDLLYFDLHEVFSSSAILNHDSKIYFFFTLKARS